MKRLRPYTVATRDKAETKHYLKKLMMMVASTQVVLDRAPPTLEVRSPREGARLQQDSTVVDLRFDRWDENGVHRAYYMVDTGEWVAIDLDEDVTRIDMGSTGKQRLHVSVADEAGNINSVIVEFSLEEKPGSPWTVVALVTAGVVAALAVLVYLRRRGDGAA